MKNIHEITETADIHVKRIHAALKKLNIFFPSSAEKIATIDEETLAWLDFLIYRFGKLQDLIGSKLIDAYLELHQESIMQLTMLDKLNKLERLGLLKMDLWLKMREARNHVSHEYPNEPALTAYYLNQIKELTPFLLDFYNNIRQKIHNLDTKK